MAEAAQDIRQCPTRSDAQVNFLTQRVTRSKCQDRQRIGYHKCYTCKHRNERVAEGKVPKALRFGGSGPAPLAGGAHG